MNLFASVAFTTLVATSLLTLDAASTPSPERIAQGCASKLHIPYGSAKITESEFQQFKTCVAKVIDEQQTSRGNSN